MGFSAGSAEKLTFFLDYIMVSGTPFWCAVKNEKNMSAFWNLIGNMVSGFIPSVVSMFRGLDKNGWTPDVGAEHVAEDLASLKQDNLIANFMKKSTGSGLTEADKQANAWTASREDLAWNRQMEASNTAYQRQVADMSAAGLNPILAAGGSGSSTPSASTSGSVSPSSALFNLPGILDIMAKMGVYKAQVDNIAADTGLKKANTAKTEEETIAERILNDYRSTSEELRLEGVGIANELNKSNISKVYKEIDLMENQIGLIIKQTDSESDRAAALRAESILKNAQASEIVALLPYHKILLQSQSDSAKSAALLSCAEAAYRQGLIDNGYIEAVCRQVNASASNAEINQQVNEVRSMFKTGKILPEYDSGVNRFILKNVLHPLNLLLDNFNPLANILGSAESTAIKAIP